jgi:hypothetical protein
MSWEALCAEASAFATEVGKERLINISVAASGGSDVFGFGGSGVNCGLVLGMTDEGNGPIRSRKRWRTEAREVLFPTQSRCLDYWPITDSRPSIAPTIS